MQSQRLSRFSAGFGMAAVITAAVLVATHPDNPAASNLAGGSGDSSTGGTYVSPVVPAMKIDPTAMSMGGTATAAAPASSEATSFASPTLKATAAAGCVNNGQCP